ncbi:MAG TPA: hypothetical protein VIG24_16565 [Acidimicrobiia bacterium]
MALNANGLNAEVEGLTAVAGFASLHTAEPDANGSNEVSGGSYTREAIVWASASGGTAVSDAQIVFDVPTGTTITHLGYWSAGTAGTFYGFRALDVSQTFSSAGTYTIAAGNLSESVS